MYKKLRKKLILTYWISSIVVLTGILIASLVVNILSDYNYEKDTFELKTTETFHLLGTNKHLDLTWLKNIEQKNHWCIRFYQNDIDLDLPNTLSLSDETIEALQSSLDCSVTKIDPTFFQSVYIKNTVFSNIEAIHNASNDYYGRVGLILSGNKLQTIYIFQMKTSLFTLLNRHIYPILLFEIIGAILLFTISKSFVRYAIHPVEVADQKQKEFIACVSHELRTPLSVMRVGLGSMKQALDSNQPAKLRKYFYPLEGECIRMERLTQDMLLLAATDQKNWSIQMESVDIETILIDCYDAFCMLNAKHQDKIKIQISEDDFPEFMGDKERLKQVFMILLDNAMSYTDIKEGIEIHASILKNAIQIRIVDHGTGMTNVQKKKVFEPFYRSELSRTDHNHFGLGLSIAKRLIELHHGTISIDDTPGHGSTFVITLPTMSPKD